MISLFGSTYGAGIPLMLAGMPLVLGFLIYVYRRQGVADKKKIGTLFFLKDLSQPIVSRSRFVPPPRFFFELLLLLLLILGSSDVFTERQDDKIALIIDNSFSLFMRADGSPDSPTLFEDVKAQARLSLNSMSSNTLVEVYVTSPYFHSKTEGLSGLRAAEREIDALQVQYSADNLEAALTRVAGDARFKTIQVFSDRERALYSSSTSSDTDSRFEFKSPPRGVGRTPGNIALTSIAATTQDKTVQVRAHVSNFSQSTASITAALSGVPLRSNQIERMQQQEHTIEPGKEHELSFTVSAEGYRGFQIQIQTSSAQLDLIPEDNVAYVSVSGGSKRLILVTEFDEGDLNIGALPVSGFDVLGPDEYENQAGQLSGRTIIFHRIAPSRLPENDALFIVPPEGSFFSAGSLIEDPVSITRWDPSNPLLAYLNVPALKPAAMMPLKTPGWAHTVINAAPGPLLVSGETGGYRYAALGVELFPFKGADDPAVSVLTLNVLKWIQQGTLSSGYVPVGSAIEVASSVSQAQYLDGRPIDLEKTETGLSLRAESPGFVSVEGEDATLLAASFFSAMESDIAHLVSVPLPERRVEAKNRSENGGLGSLLAWILIALIVADMLISTRGFGFLPFLTPQRKQEAVS